MYEGVFGRVVTCGPKPSSFNKNFKPDIIFEVESGHFSYECLGIAMDTFPGYRGYVYGNDDMIINWWNFRNLDLNKIWQGSRIVDFRQDAYGSPIRNWIWWKTEMGLSACQNFYTDLLRLGNASLIDHYTRNGKGRPRCGKGWTDFFYVPAALAPQFRQLSTIAYKNKLYLEIAVHNILRCLDLESNFIVLDGVYLPDIGIKECDEVTFWKFYNSRHAFIHPFKLNLHLKYQRKEFKTRILSLRDRLLAC